MLKKSILILLFFISGSIFGMQQSIGKQPCFLPTRSRLAASLLIAGPLGHAAYRYINKSDLDSFCMQHAIKKPKPKLNPIDTDKQISVRVGQCQAITNISILNPVTSTSHSFIIQPSKQTIEQADSASTYTMQIPIDNPQIESQGELKNRIIEELNKLFSIKKENQFETIQNAVDKVCIDIRSLNDCNALLELGDLKKLYLNNDIVGLGLLRRFINQGRAANTSFYSTYISLSVHISIVESLIKMSLGSSCEEISSCEKILFSTETLKLFHRYHKNLSIFKINESNCNTQESQREFHRLLTNYKNILYFKLTNYKNMLYSRNLYNYCVKRTKKSDLTILTPDVFYAILKFNFIYPDNRFVHEQTT